MTKVLLTLYDGEVIVAKRFGFLSGELMGVRALCDDGTFRLFAVKSNPTNAEFHDIQAAADATYEEKKKAVEEATGWESEDELPWLDIEGDDEDDDGATNLLERINTWLESEVELDELECWGARKAGEYVPGFELMDALSVDERDLLGLREQDMGGPASSVPCVTTTASLEELNGMIERKKLPFVFVDEVGPEDNL